MQREHRMEHGPVLKEVGVLNFIRIQQVRTYDASLGPVPAGGAYSMAVACELEPRLQCRQAGNDHSPYRHFGTSEGVGTCSIM